MTTKKIVIKVDGLLGDQVTVEQCGYGGAIVELSTLNGENYGILAASQVRKLILALQTILETEHDAEK